MYGVSEEGHPEVFLNGFYYSGGNDVNAVTNITSAVEEMLSAPLRAQHQLMASMYGGVISGQLEGYSSTTVRAMRLRALDNGRGKPETRIYDDLGREINKWMDYEYGEKKYVLHKTLKEVPRADIEEIAKEEIQQATHMPQATTQTAITQVKNRLRSLFTP